MLSCWLLLSFCFHFTLGGSETWPRKIKFPHIQYRMHPTCTVWYQLIKSAMWCDVREVSHCTDGSGCEMCFETTPLPRLTPSKVTHQNRSTTTYNHWLPKMESFLSRCVFSALLPNGLLLWKSSWPLQQSQLYIQMSSSNGLNFIVVQKPLGTAQMCPKVLSLWPQSWFSF